MGETNFVSGTVASRDGGNVRVETALGVFEGRTPNGWQPAAGETCTLSVRPEALRLSTEPSSANGIRGRLESRVYLGEMAQYQFRPASGGEPLKIYELNPRFVDAPEDRDLHASAAPEDVVILRA
jgi:ABC-type Fe3+/spermidine/putrescine transport system ATPase subunit